MVTDSRSHVLRTRAWRFGTRPTGPCQAGPGRWHTGPREKPHRREGVAPPDFAIPSAGRARRRQLGHCRGIAAMPHSLSLLLAPSRALSLSSPPLRLAPTHPPLRLHHDGGHPSWARRGGRLLASPPPSPCRQGFRAVRRRGVPRRACGRGWRGGGQGEEGGGVPEQVPGPGAAGGRGGERGGGALPQRDSPAAGRHGRAHPAQPRRLLRPASRVRPTAHPRFLPQLCAPSCRSLPFTVLREY